MQPKHFIESDFPDPWDVDHELDRLTSINHPDGCRIIVTPQHKVSMVWGTDGNVVGLFGPRSTGTSARAVQLAKELVTLHDHLESLHKRKGKNELAERLLAEVDDDETESES